MIRIAICDDDSQLLETIKQTTEQYMNTRNVNFCIKTFGTGEDLLFNIEDSGIYQILFLDIELTKINGIKTAAILRERYPSMVLIFISGHSKYYKAAFDVQPFQFLDKPIKYQEFVATLEKALNHVRNDMEMISFFHNRKHYWLRIGDIIYLESNKRMITAVAVSGCFDFYEKMESLEQYLADRQQRFLRIHKSFLINANHIRELAYSSVIMSNGVELTISRDKKKYVREYYMNWLGGIQD